MAEIDKYQKDAIDTKINSVVSAGAGSGKTRVLSERFTDLVINRGCKVDEILTLTFTKKATTEMSSRIYNVLKEKIPEKAKDFYKANIKTIDAYCNSVAKTGCNRYGISPDFTQDESAISAQVSAMALPFILEHRNNLAIKALVNTKDYATIAEELFVNPMIKISTITTPIDFDKGIEIQQKEILAAWKTHSEKADSALYSLKSAYEEFTGNTKSKFMEKFIPLITQNFPDLPELTISHIETSNSEEFEAYTCFFHKIANVSLVGTGRTAELDLIKEILYEMREIEKFLISICNYIHGFYITKELLPLLKEFQNKVLSLKRSSGVLTFRDISNLAYCILRDYPDLRQIEKKKYKAIMIDEFQDNNQQQRDLLFMLAEKEERLEVGIPKVEDLCPDKLFFVGDEKQSIYRFRDADVSVFRALSQDFKDGNLSMSTNYRSHPALINAFNIIFGGNPSAFYANENDNSIPNYEAIYHKVNVPEAKQKEFQENPENLLEKHLHIARFDTELEKERINNPEFVTEEEAEARWIANKIKELCTVGVNKEIYKPGDIAILLRNYSLQPLYERVFLNSGIPYNTETVTGFFSDGPVNDIFSFLRICIYDKDTISYAQILRSPFVNLSVAETNAVILTDESPFDGKSETILQNEGLENYCHAKNFFIEMQDAAKNEPITKLVSKLWYEAGYRYETMWNKKVSMYAKMYDLIFELARQSEQKNMSLSAFVDSVRTYHDQKAKLENMDIPMEKSDGVHILTIHKSKGLEYKVVFVCGTHKKGGDEKNTSPIYSSKEFGITINTPPCKSFEEIKSNYFYDLVHAKNKKMDSAELRRVVYVALTRAISELYITNGKYKLDSNAAEKYLPGGTNNVETIYQVLAPIISHYEQLPDKSELFFDVENIPSYKISNQSERENVKNNTAAKINLIESIEEAGIYDSAEVISKEIVEKKYILPSQLHSADEETGNTFEKRNFEENQNIPYMEINSIIASTIPKKDGEPIEGALPKFDFTNFGTIAHAYMEAVIAKEPAKISNRDLVGLENHQKDFEIIVKICQEMQEKFKQSELGIAAINSKWHKPEYEFRYKLDDKIVKGVIDLVFENPDGTFVVVDYKTNQSIEPEIYYNQLACYRQAVAQMRGVDVSAVSCWLYYLRFGKAVEITDHCKI